MLIQNLDVFNMGHGRKRRHSDFDSSFTNTKERDSASPETSEINNSTPSSDGRSFDNLDLLLAAVYIITFYLMIGRQRI